MIGRLIVALLVIGSAAFVMLQRRATESTDIAADLTAMRARHSDERALELEEQVRTLRDHVSALEHDLEWQREQLGALAADCTPIAPDQPQVQVAKLVHRPPRSKEAWHPSERVGLLLAGDAATITRVRLFSSLDDGTPLNDLASCDTLGSDGGLLLGVIAGGRDVVQQLGPQRIAKRAGVVPFELVCDAGLARERPLSVELVLAGGGTVRATAPPAAPPPTATPQR